MPDSSEILAPFADPPRRERPLTIALPVDDDERETIRAEAERRGFTTVAGLLRAALRAYLATGAA